MLAQADAYLQTLHERHRHRVDGEPAGYIPALKNAPPDAFGIALATVDGRVHVAGDAEAVFTVQSISKAFTYGLALDQLGRAAVRSKVGVEPTGEAFNSILELEEEVHRPYNPMINAGAIAIAALLNEASGTDEAALQTRQLWAGLLGRPGEVDHEVMASELATGHRNRAIAHLLRHFDVIGEDIEAALATYYRQCAVRVTVRDLAVMGATLAHRGVQPCTGERVFKPDSVRDVLALMFTCGMYDSAGRWAYTVGLPAKSGVSGGLLAVAPGLMGLAVYSPRLDAHGHSVRGVEVLKDWSQEWGLGLFG
jgi:glutaminase